MLLPDGLARAWTAEVPGPLEPAGPQNTPVRGVIQHPVAVGVPVTAMLRAIWWSDGFHPNPVTGLPGKVRQRPVPSAGGCYPVQLRVLCGEGCDVPPGMYVFNSGGSGSSSGGQLLRVQGNDASSHDKLELRAPARGAVVVLTVLPQRTMSKYHHRSGPLLIADTAYAAVALLHHAAALEVIAWWDVVAPQRWPGSTTEFALAKVALGTAWTETDKTDVDPAGSRIVGVTKTQLATRRSADMPGSRSRASAASGQANMVLQRLLDYCLPTFHEPVPPSCRFRVLSKELLQSPLLAERCAGQHWVRNLHAMVIFETSATPSPDAMWWSSALAAHILYTALGTETALDFRPVGGWTGSQGGWTTLHGLGVVLREPYDRYQERPANAGQ